MIQIIFVSYIMDYIFAFLTIHIFFFLPIIVILQSVKSKNSVKLITISMRNKDKSYKLGASKMECA